MSKNKKSHKILGISIFFCDLNLKISSDLHFFDDKVSNQVNDQVNKNENESQKIEIPNLNEKAFSQMGKAKDDSLSNSNSLSTQNQDGQSENQIVKGGESETPESGSASITGIKNFISYPNNKNMVVPQSGFEKEHKIDTDKLENITKKSNIILLFLMFFLSGCSCVARGFRYQARKRNAKGVDT